MQRARLRAVGGGKRGSGGNRGETGRGVRQRGSGRQRKEGSACQPGLDDLFLTRVPQNNEICSVESSGEDGVILICVVPFGLQIFEPAANDRIGFTWG